jgi:hypothetical protein
LPLSDASDPFLIAVAWGGGLWLERLGLFFLL